MPLHVAMQSLADTRSMYLTNSQCTWQHYSSILMGLTRSVLMQTVTTTRQQIRDYNALILAKVDQLRGDTVGNINKYEDKYLPKVNKYDDM